jgi:hypothetical protein
MTMTKGREKVKMKRRMSERERERDREWEREKKQSKFVALNSGSPPVLTADRRKMCRERHYIMGEGGGDLDPWELGNLGSFWRFLQIFGSWGERNSGDKGRWRFHRGHQTPSRRQLSLLRQTSQLICPWKVHSEIIF